MELASVVVGLLVMVMMSKSSANDQEWENKIVMMGRLMASNYLKGREVEWPMAMDSER